MILKNKIYLLLSILFIACTDTNYYQSQDKARLFKVGAGDTLYNIALHYNISVRDLIEANNLKAPYNVQIGKKLIIPQIKYHTVRVGDNLFQISRLYGVSVSKLIELNKLPKPYNISVGSKLMVSNSTFSIPKSSSNNLKKTSATTANIDHSNDRKEISPATNHNFIWPVQGTIISAFGQKSGGLYNDGINIKAAEGTPVKATEDGVTAYVGNELRGYGNLIILKHSGGWISAYAHLSKTKLKIGDNVKQGTKIANVGATGNVDFAQLYFGIRKGKDAVNPGKYLK